MITTRGFKALLPLLLMAGPLSLGLTSAASAGVTVVDMTRINIDINYDDKTGWDLGAHDELYDIFYKADGVLFYASELDRRTVPDDTDFGFLGADPGDTIWVLPQVFDPARITIDNSPIGKVPPRAYWFQSLLNS